AFLERLHLGRALRAAAAVDVQVREDPQEPRPQVRAGRERAPTPERPCVRLLHEILGLLARRDEPARDAVDLVGELERLLLEVHAVASHLGEPPRFGGFGPRLTHPQATLAAAVCLERRRGTRPRPPRRGRGGGSGWMATRSSRATTRRSARYAGRRPSTCW